MELTPELLLEAKFGPARRGYDMAEVDDFLERCAEGLDVLLDRLKAEFERAERAEARVAELEGTAADPTVVEPSRAPGVGEVADTAGAVGADEVADEAERPSADEPMRILVHAERTAEAAITEARAEAERIRSEAENVANQQRTEAETVLATAKAQAEEEARQAGEEVKREVQAEVMTLRHDRDALADDIRSLRRWLDEQRTRMRSTARELQRLVEDPDALGDLGVPEMTGSDEPADGDGTGEVPETDAGEWRAADPAFETEDSTQALPTVGTEAAAEAAPEDPWDEPDR